MKKLKLFFACLLMAVLSIGQVWGAIDANSTWTATAFGDLPDGATVIMINNFGNSFANATVTKAPAKVAASFNSTTKKITVSTEGKSLDDIAWTVEKATNGTKFWVCGSTTNILGLSKTNDNNAVSVNVTTTAQYNEFVLDGGLLKYYNASRYVGEYVSGSDWRSYNSATANNYKSGSTTQSLTFYVLDEGEETACATPSFTPAAGAVLSGTTVAISCATEGATIHYTTDGTEPTASSPTYSSAITIDEAKTIKAIAVKGGLDNSGVATASYTIVEPLTTMQAIFEAATTTATPTYITFSSSWVVTGVATNGKNVYITDGTKGMILYNGSGNMGLAVGNTLSGTVQRSLKLYNGAAELDGFTTDGLTKGTADLPNVQALDAEGIAGLSGVNTGSLIKISGACTQESSKYYVAGVQLFNTLFAYTAPTAGNDYNVTGVYVQYNSTKEVLPRSAADIEEVTASGAPEAPTFSVAAGEYTSAQSVELSCATDGATIYYTTDGSTPDNTKNEYTAAIAVGETMTIKAVAIKDELSSAIASAAYVINIPLPEHTFQVTHHFSTGEGFEFPTGWGGSYAEHEIAYTDDKVHFVSASHQSGTITDRPVTKNQAISLILTNSHKLISAVRFDYAQWGTKAQTLTMKYSTDGGETYSDFDPVVSSTDFALQVLTMPEGVNAIQVTGANSSSQVGLTSIAFDLEDKVVVTKTVTITTPTNGTLVVKNAGVAISSGDAIEVGTTLTIEATPASGYLLDAVSVIDEDEDPVSVSEYAFVVPSKNVTVSATFIENVKPDATLTLSEIGVTHDITGHKQDDVINLPLTATSCSKTFVGWDADADCDHAPTYAPGAEYTLASTTQTLYAVYANPAAGSTWNVATSVTAGDVVVISTNTGYTANDMKTAGAIASSIFGATASTYGSENAQITELAEGTMEFTIGGNATDGWTLKNGTKYLKVTAAKKVGLVDDEETWTISFSGNNATLAPKTGDFTGYSIQYNYNTGNDRFTAYNTTQVAISLYKQVASYSNYSTDCQAAVATPTFSPAAGTYTEAQTVTISCATEEATIYYTTDGSTPTNESTEYTAAISVDENMTIKAIAVKAGMANSAVASASYTINLPLSTMDQIFAAATAAGSTATDANIAFNNWVVSGVSTNGKNVFVTDGTKGFIIFDNGGEMGFAVGDVLSGTVACKVQLYKGAAELTTLSASTEGLSIAKEGVVTPAVKAINALSGINTGAAVTINSVQFDGTNLSDGANSIKPYNTLFAYDALTENTYYNVTGIYQQFDATKEILPRSAADIEALVLDDPELSYDPASVSLEVGQALSAPTFNNPHDVSPINYEVSGDAVATVTNEGVIALVENATGTAVITASFAGNGTYAAGNATFTITVSEPVDAKNVVIIAEYDSKFYALTTNVSNKTAAAVEVEKDGSNIIVTSAEAKAAIQWKKIIDGENTTFQDADDNYLKGTSGGGDLTLVTTVCNWSWDGTNNCYAIGSRSFIYRESANGFKNYSIGNAGGSDYSALAEVIEIDPENIIVVVPTTHTLSYNPNGGTVIEGEDAIADAQVAEGATVTVAANVYEKDGYSFAGWLYGETVYNAGQTFPMPTTDVELVAQWTEQVVSDYVLVTNVSQLQAGDKVIIVAAEYNVAAGSAAATYRNPVEIAKTSDKSHLIFGESMPTEFTLGIPADGEYSFNDGDGFMYESTVKSVKVQDESFSWSISIDAEAIATISATNELKYNSGSPRFTTYASGQSALQLYRKPGDTPEPEYETVRAGLECGRHYTVCLAKNITHIEGATFWNLTYRNNAGTEVYLVGEDAPEAGKPYIFQATAETLRVVYGEETADAPVDNGALRGTFSNMLASDLNAINVGVNKVYMLFNNELRPIGTNNHLDANRAYVLYNELQPVNAAPQIPGKKVKRMPMQGQTTTGCELINAAEAPAKMMINGQLFILRGEKKYDATGRLVK